MANISAARDLPAMRPRDNLAAARPENSTGVLPCINALTQVKSCSGDIIIFLRQGYTHHISPYCCRAISLITHHCWPALLISIGFTPKEGNILGSYCDAPVFSPAPPLSQGDHAPAPAPLKKGSPARPA
ncbi:egg cell-secreted protein 1.4-like [Corylus avellana]|uniref:egg cell-secreted protein 1.4-like n=1 Tax=Corylus avellana TaxID=13451 RepID=UPI00286B320E|nr:egg cell-secreted protein 1.4-like [Corylus avellana]